jgi:hypothetical protein
MSLTVVPVANLTNGQYLVGILDNATTSKLWSMTPYSSAALGDAEAPTIPDNGMIGFPTVDEVEIDPAPDGTANVGIVTITWESNVTSLASPGPYVIETGPNALAIVASTSTG